MAITTDKTRGQNLQFVAITGTRDQLYGIDRAGKVWKYIPAKKEGQDQKSYAFWTRITSWTPITGDEEPK